MSSPFNIFISQVVATIFALLFLYHFIKAYNSADHEVTNYDLFPIGYLEKDDSNVNVVVTPSRTKINFESQQIYKDCIDALCAIGVKKTEAKKKAKEIFSSMDEPPQNIQDFLMIALKR